MDLAKEVSLGVYLHGTGVWGMASGLRDRGLVRAWYVPSLVHPWADLHGWPPREPVVEVQPGFDPSAWTPGGQAFARDAGYVLAVDASPDKGGRLVLELARMLPGVRFVVASGGGSSPYLGLETLPNVTVLPQQEDMAAVYAVARCLLLTSPSESFGLAAVEAQACGVPVLCSGIPTLRRTCGTGAWYLPPGGLSVDANTVCAWALALRTVLGSTTARYAMRMRGLENARRYRPDVDFAPLLGLLGEGRVPCSRTTDAG